MRIRGQSKMWVALAASGVLLRLLTRDRALRPPVERSRSMPKPAAAAAGADAWTSDAAYGAGPETAATGEAIALGSGDSGNISSDAGPTQTGGTGEPGGEASSDWARHLTQLPRRELFRMARSKGVPHTVMMTKADLIEALSKLDN
jgi:hypothetical protein